ncbi:MAG TPA: DUF6289 family protein [Thermoanaerobaculia bacterium]|nr:DUF6289 family protein [Thermoanaerobaculia bacterium]
MHKKSTSSVRKIVLMVFALAIVVFALTADFRTAEAVVIAGPSICTYYSNAAYTTAVGARGTGCCGAPISWGVTSAYKKCERLYCLDVICPN